MLRALSGMNGRFGELERTMRERHQVREDRPLVGFYMKGGNAFTVAIEQDLTSGGKSDWDTQVVINPWAPPPIVDIVHDLVEDVVIDELRQAGLEIAKAVGASGVDLASDVKSAWELAKADVQKMNLSNYSLTLDKPQTLRRIFDRDRLGLWFQTGTPLRDRTSEAESKWIPGQLYNDAIKPFILYRMGYTWHADLNEVRDHHFKEVAIARPLLMELIDVTIPRRNTVEGVEVWDAIAHDLITIGAQRVGFNTNEAAVSLPFPDIYYHLREQLDMLCEIADGSSHHQDKMGRRFERLREIYDNRRVDQSRCVKIVGEQAGVADIWKLGEEGAITIAESLYKLIIDLPAGQRDEFDPKQKDGRYTLNPADLAYRMGILMMMAVVGATENRRKAFDEGRLTGAARKRLAASRMQFEKLKDEDGFLGLAASDDLVFFEQLDRNGYLQLAKVGICGIDGAALCRVRDGDALRAIATAVEKKFDGQGQFYNTPRENGYSSEFASVLFADSRATAMLTLTTASPQELSFGSTPQGIFGPLPTAPLVEIARQRKMAASLIRDYTLRRALSQQYEAGKESIAVT